MFNLLHKKEYKEITIRAEDLKVGDRFVYDSVPVQVKEVVPGPAMVLVTLEERHLGPQPSEWKLVYLFNIMFISVDRY